MVSSYQRVADVVCGIMTYAHAVASSTRVEMHLRQIGLVKGCVKILSSGLRDGDAMGKQWIWERAGSGNNRVSMRLEVWKPNLSATPQAAA